MRTHVHTHMRAHTHTHTHTLTDIHTRTSAGGARTTLLLAKCLLVDDTVLVNMLADPTAAAAQPYAPDPASAAQPSTVELEVCKGAFFCLYLGSKQMRSRGAPSTMLKVSPQAHTLALVVFQMPSSL